MHHAKSKPKGGAILFDLFIATVIFATCAVAIGQFGSQALELAKVNGLERLELVKAESILAQELVQGCQAGERTWRDSFNGTLFDIQVQWSETELPGLWRVAVRVTSVNANPSSRPSVSLSRLLSQEGEP